MPPSTSPITPLPSPRHGERFHTAVNTCPCDADYNASIQNQSIQKNKSTDGSGVFLKAEHQSMKRYRPRGDRDITWLLHRTVLWYEHRCQGCRCAMPLPEWGRGGSICSCLGSWFLLFWQRITAWPTPRETLLASSRILGRRGSPAPKECIVRWKILFLVVSRHIKPHDAQGEQPVTCARFFLLTSTATKPVAIRARRQTGSGVR